MSEVMEIPDFLKDLQMAAKPREGSNQGRRKFQNDSVDIQVFNMSNFNNHGTFNIVPIDGPDGSKGLTTLNRVATVEKWISGKDKDGREYGFIDRKYFFMDGRIYGDLSPEEKVVFERIKSKINSIPKNKGVSIGRIVLLQGFVMEHKDLKGNLLLQNDAAMYIFKYANFIKELEAKMSAQAELAGNYAWVNELISREVTPRKRFINSSVQIKEGTVGAVVTISLQKFDSDTVRFTKGKEYLDLNDFDAEKILGKLGNPVKKFCGISNDRRLFDEDYLAEIEGRLNNIIEGKPNEEVNEPRTPVAPDSNASYRSEAQPESKQEIKQENNEPKSEVKEEVPTPEVKVENTDTAPVENEIKGGFSGGIEDLPF